MRINTQVSLMEVDLQSLIKTHCSSEACKDVAVMEMMKVEEGDSPVSITTREKSCVESQREKMERHWREVGGKVVVPDTWGQEQLLTQWMDCSFFDAMLAPEGIRSARAALISEGRKASSRRFGIKSRC
ncbi:hypothetical protein NMG60_11033389 [Bertholletia excelsa]